MRKATMMTTLVLGGTGKTGRRIVQRLQARGVPVRIGSRSGNPAYDWDDPATWAPALEGVDAVYVSYHPDLATPGAPEVIRSFAEFAAHTGVRRLVLLSGRGEEDAQLSEKALQSFGADWTVLRASWFNQNFSEGFLYDQVRSGFVALPSGDVPEPFVDVDDLADVAVEVLADDKHIHQTYELTGPRLMTFEEAVGEIAAATGKPIGYQQIPVSDYVSAVRESGAPEVIVELTAYLFGSVLDGRNAQVTDGVEQVLGRPARDFADFARVTAAGGAW
jgi:uncharacterized protein YbjT (DUF2867 family)